MEKHFSGKSMANAEGSFRLRRKPTRAVRPDRYRKEFIRPDASPHRYAKRCRRGVPIPRPPPVAGSGLAAKDFAPTSCFQGACDEGHLTNLKICEMLRLASAEVLPRILARDKLHRDAQRTSAKNHSDHCPKRCARRRGSISELATFTFPNPRKFSWNCMELICWREESSTSQKVGAWRARTR
jgi:hypothetical protein